MLIALDYDGTYTEDPALWDAFISNAQSKGHRVICVTMRNEDELSDMSEHLLSLVDELHYTSRAAKETFLANLQIFPDVWIDDNPRWIYMDSI